MSIESLQILGDQLWERIARSVEIVEERLRRTVAILEQAGVGEGDRLAPRVLSREIITGVDPHQSAMINRMRHGDMLLGGQTMYTLEVHPAGYAAIAANEAEKRADVRLLEVVTFGAVGRLWLGGSEESIRQAAAAIDETLSAITGRPNEGAR